MIADQVKTSSSDTVWSQVIFQHGSYKFRNFSFKGFFQGFQTTFKESVSPDKSLNSVDIILHILHMKQNWMMLTSLAPNFHIFFFVFHLSYAISIHSRPCVSVTHSAIASCATFLFLPHFEVICDLLLNRRTTTCNLSLNQISRRKNFRSRVRLTKLEPDWVLRQERREFVIR